MVQTFRIDGNTVTIHSTAHGPQGLMRLIYLHVVEGDGLDVFEQCQLLGLQNFALVAIKPLSWEDNLTPWECTGLFAGDKPFAGQACKQLDLLEHVIVPKVESELRQPVSCRIVAGYSLAGLFATWAVFNSATFDGLASVSGSLWYPGFAQYAASNSLESPLTCAYFSLGSKEVRTSNQLLRNVVQGTHDTVAAFRKQGVHCTFEQNSGNHFREPALRTAKGIYWALMHQ